MKAWLTIFSSFVPSSLLAIPTNINGITVRFVGRKELLINKLASGHPEDLVDHMALLPKDPE